MPRRTRRRVPTLHLVMIYTSGALIVLFGFGYFFAPPSKAETFATFLMAMLGFLTGKFTNSFGRPFGDSDRSFDDGEGSILHEEREADHGEHRA